jgi:tRNA(Ile)-lysidine synthase TilS/MesJ
MRHCVRCVLPESFPGIDFNSAGLCTFCLRYRGGLEGVKKKKRYQDRFIELVRERRGKGRYDALIAYSGGKDSTQALYLVKSKYRLSALALTFDNGFLPPQTLRNIRKVVRSLGVDHHFVRPDFRLLKDVFGGCAVKDIFPGPALSRASSICTACMAMVKFSALRLAVEREIPLVIFGWSPGQIPLASSILKMTAAMAGEMQSVVLRPLEKLAGEGIRSLFLDAGHLAKTRAFPHFVSPLAFLEYDEGKILRSVRRLGWRAPSGVDSNSTNCLLNSLANVIHRERHEYHPYVFELAKLVREGILERDEAFAKLDEPESPVTLKFVKKKLGLSRC